MQMTAFINTYTSIITKKPQAANMSLSETGHGLTVTEEECECNSRFSLRYMRKLLSKAPSERELAAKLTEGECECNSRFSLCYMRKLLPKAPSERELAAKLTEGECECNSWLSLRYMQMYYKAK